MMIVSVCATAISWMLTDPGPMVARSVQDLTHVPGLMCNLEADRFPAAVGRITEVAVFRPRDCPNSSRRTATTPLFAVGGPGGWLGVFPVEPADGQPGDAHGTIARMRVLAVQSFPVHAALRIEFALERDAPRRARSRFVTWCHAPNESIACVAFARAEADSYPFADMRADPRAWALDPRRVGVIIVSGRAFELARLDSNVPRHVRAFTDDSLLGLTADLATCTESGFAEPFSATLPQAIDKFVFMASTGEDDMCGRWNLAWRGGGRLGSVGEGAPPGVAFRIDALEPGFPGSTVAVGRFERRAIVWSGGPAGCEPHTEGDPGSERTGELIVSFALVARPLGDEVALTRFVTGIAVEIRGKVVERWERTLAITPDGIELGRASGRIAPFRQTGRFAWADVRELIDNEMRIAKAMLDGALGKAIRECERTGRLDPFLSGYLEPLLHPMLDEVLLTAGRERGTNSIDTEE